MYAAFAIAAHTLPLAAQNHKFLNHNNPVPDAHNCYPYKGQFADRIDRALRTPFPVGIEQDIAWAKGQPVVSHDAKTTGGEPTLPAHFLERVRPSTSRALADHTRRSWPINRV